MVFLMIFSGLKALIKADGMPPFPKNARKHGEKTKRFFLAFMVSHFGLKAIFSFVFLVSGIHSYGQNLIVNPSFENHKTCPKYLSNFRTDVQDWSTPTRGTTDYFHTCSEDMGVPNNFNGFQRAKFGESYAGLYVYAPNDYREYIQATIFNTLQKGEKYRLSFYISLAEASDFALRDLNILFSSKPLNLITDKNLSKSKLVQLKSEHVYTLPVPTSGFLGESKKWTLLSLEFEAKGTERFISLGNFKNNTKSARMKPKNIGPRPVRKQKGLVSYYYIDMISLISLTEQEGALAYYELEKPHIFKNVLFDFDAFELSDASKIELKRMYAYLKNDDQLHIHITGHTDNFGSISYNSKLARSRAGEVSKYLIELGLPKNRISWQGRGGRFPIADNALELGRKQNRRVEFIISQRDEHELNK